MDVHPRCLQGMLGNICQGFLDDPEHCFGRGVVEIGAFREPAIEADFNPNLALPLRTHICKRCNQPATAWNTATLAGVDRL